VERILTQLDLKVADSLRTTNRVVDKGLVEAISRLCAGIDKFGSFAFDGGFVDIMLKANICS
jgi:hypothetical protein